jgi:hypothetical protein
MKKPYNNTHRGVDHHNNSGNIEKGSVERWKENKNCGL